MREEILKYLGTVAHSTAKTIAEKLCADRLVVSRELNAMEKDGVIERKMEGAGARHMEYVYWLTRKDASVTSSDGVDMHPKTLTASAVAAPKSVSPVVEKPEVAETEVSAVEQSLDLALQLQAMTRERDQVAIERDNLVRRFLALGDKTTVQQLKSQITELEDKASVLQLQFDRQAVADRETRAERDKISDMLNECQLARDQWKAKHDALQQQIDQYDERQRFETWFKLRPESKGSTDSTSLKEKMWESWLERSKHVEVAA